MDLLEVRNVSKIYGSGETAVQALQKVYFSVPKGEYVAIGRALITRPSLILADEPTGNLDTQNSREVITHRRSIAQTADRVLDVSDGVLTDWRRCSE